MIKSKRNTSIHLIKNEHIFHQNLTNIATSWYKSRPLCTAYNWEWMWGPFVYFKSIDKWSFQVLHNGFFDFVGLLKVKVLGIVRIDEWHLVLAPSQPEQRISVMRQSGDLSLGRMKPLICGLRGLSTLKLELSRRILKPGKLIGSIIPMGGGLHFRVGKRPMIKAIKLRSFI